MCVCESMAHIRRGREERGTPVLLPSDDLQISSGLSTLLSAGSCSPPLVRTMIALPSRSLSSSLPDSHPKDSLMSLACSCLSQSPCLLVSTFASLHKEPIQVSDSATSPDSMLNILAKSTAMASVGIMFSSEGQFWTLQRGLPLLSQTGGGSTQS